MKKLVYVFGITAFLLFGTAATASLTTDLSRKANVVQDDPPSKKSKKHKCCSDYGKFDDCKSKKHSHSSKSKCDTKGKKHDTTEKNTQDTDKKATPDKK